MTNSKECEGTQRIFMADWCYRRFVANYGAITTPLTQLTKKNDFCWSEEASRAFESLKKAMVMLPVLSLPDFQFPFEIETNAFEFSLHAVLSQNKRPITYFSKKMSDIVLEKSIYERELMAIVLAVETHTTCWDIVLLCISESIEAHLGT